MGLDRGIGGVLVETAQLQEIRRELGNDMAGVLTPGRANGYPQSVSNEWFDGSEIILPVGSITDTERTDRGAESELLARFCNQMIWTKPIWIDNVSYSLRSSALGARCLHREDGGPRVDLVASRDGLDRGIDVLTADFVVATVNDEGLAAPLNPDIVVTLDWVDDLNHLLPLMASKLGLPSLRR